MPRGMSSERMPIANNFSYRMDFSMLQQWETFNSSFRMTHGKPDTILQELLQNLQCSIRSRPLIYEMPIQTMGTLARELALRYSEDNDIG